MTKRARSVVAAATSAEMPGFIKPQLATLKAKAPSGDHWLHEIKFDGYRVQVHLNKGKKRVSFASHSSPPGSSCPSQVLVSAMISSTLHTLIVIPAIFGLVKGFRLPPEDKPRPRGKTKAIVTNLRVPEPAE
jgi:hypothetical protein